MSADVSTGHAPAPDQPRLSPVPSGRLLLRRPPDLHAELSRAAEREGTSLNASITRRLTESVGWGEGADHSEPERSRLLPALLIANAVVVGLAAILSVVILLIALG